MRPQKVRVRRLDRFHCPGELSEWEENIMGDVILPFSVSGSGSNPSCKFKSNSYSMDGGRKYTLSSLIDEGTLFMVIVLTQQETTLGYRDGGTSYTGANYHVKLPSIIAVCNTGAVQTIKFGYYSTLSMTSTGACTLSTGPSSTKYDLYSLPMLACVFYA